MVRVLLAFLLFKGTDADLIAYRADQEEEIVPPPLTMAGLLALVVVWGSTRLLYALDGSTTVGFLRKTVARRVGQDVELRKHGPSHRMADEELVHQVSSVVYAHAASEATTAMGRPRLVHTGATKSELSMLANVTRERESEVSEVSSQTAPLCGCLCLPCSNSPIDPGIDLYLQKHLFTPAVRRALYNVMINPRRPGTANLAPSQAAVEAAAQNRVPFEVALYAAESPTGDGRGPATHYKFATHGGAAPPAGFAPTDERSMFEWIAQIGDPSPDGVAITEAFEGWLLDTARSWSDEDAALLPVEFLIAFGRELTTRLDISHRIRSTKLDAESLATLTTPPFGRYVDPEVVRAFQG